MKKGDFIFFKPTGTFNDFFITKVSPNFTHVGIIINPDKKLMVDASFWGGVKIRKYEINQNTVFKRIGMSEKEVENLILIAKSKIGNSYNIFGAIWSGVLRKLGLSYIVTSKDDFEHCSEFCVICIRELGGRWSNIYFGRDAASILPDDFYNFYEMRDI